MIYRKTGIRKTAILAMISIGLAPFTSCGHTEDNQEITDEGLTVDSNYRYNHIDQIIGQYCDLLMTTPPDGQQMEELLMDINSRCHLLMTEGDTLTALYFHHAIENNIRLRDSILADRIFGICPYTAFNIEAE